MNGMTKLVEQAKAVLAAGRAILVLGVTPSNVGHWYQKNDPRLIFWLSDDSQGKDAPANTGLVLTTRFVDHHVSDRVRKTMPEDAIFHPQHLPTGQLKSFLEFAYVPPPKSPEATEKTAEKKSAVPVVAPNGYSDSAKVLSTFVAGLPNVKMALEGVLRENNFLLLQKHDATQAIKDLEGAKVAVAELTTQNDELRRRLEASERSLATTQDQAVDLELHRDELAKSQDKVRDLEARLATAESRALNAEAEVGKFRQAAQVFASMASSSGK